MLPSLSLSVILSFACKVPSLPHTRTRLGLGRKAALTFPFFSSGVDSTASLSARSRQSGKTRSPNPQLQFFPLVCPCVLPPLREGAHFQPNIPPHRLGRARFLEHSSIGVFFAFFLESVLTLARNDRPLAKGHTPSGEGSATVRECACEQTPGKTRRKHFSSCVCSVFRP